MNSDEKLICFCWYQPEQWERLLEIADDRENLQDSYQEWRKTANQLLREIEASGNSYLKININLEELLLWCNEKGIPVNSQSRAQFATLVARKRNE